MEKRLEREYEKENKYKKEKKHENKKEHMYDDIIDLPHPVSDAHPRMARTDRAAQFASFAVLKGYDADTAGEQNLADENTEFGD